MINRTEAERNIEYEELLNSWLLLFRTDYDQLIFCLYARGYTQEEIGKMVGCTKQAIQSKIKYYKVLYKKLNNGE